MKVETDLVSGNKNDSRSKVPKGPIRRALVVENDPEMSEFIEEVLGSIAIEVVTPVKSIQIEAHFNKEKFDVVLIGLSTSPENDVELIREIRRSGFNQTTPIILISADQRPSALSLGFEAALPSSSTSPSIACA